jgi:hypothetical protein
VFPTNLVKQSTNTVTVTNVASGKKTEYRVRPVEPQDVRREVSAVTLNGRSRVAYNAYQRFLMQTRRAIAKGLACRWLNAA